MKNVWWIPFPKPKRQQEKCLGWIGACGREGFTTENVHKWTNICSKHFVGGNGPTLDRPDPIYSIRILLFMANVGMCFSEKVVREKRIVGGQTMKRGEWPFLVSLHYLKPFAFTRRTQMRHLCGGALIHPQWVITAGHCVGFIEGMKNVNDWNVVLGEHNQYLRDVGEQIKKPQQFFVHPEFKPYVTATLQNDIALIKLRDEVKMNRFIGIVPISNETDIADHTKCSIGGWGQVSSEPYGWGMYIPLKTSLFIVNNATCHQIYSEIEYRKSDFHMVVDETVVCAGLLSKYQTDYHESNHVNPDACNGDSGSPLLCPTGPGGQFEVVGVVSAGKGCGTGKYPGIYTKVSWFYDWITDIIMNN